METRPYLPASVKYLAVDSFYTKKTIMDAVCNLELQAVGKLRIDANLKYLYSGPQKGRGAPRKYDGKVILSDLPRLKFVCEIEPGVRMYCDRLLLVGEGRSQKICPIRVGFAEVAMGRVELIFVFVILDLP